MKNYLFITLCCLLAFSCKKQTIFDGPSVEETFSAFNVREPFDASRDSVAFAAGENVNFTAKFNKIVSWKIVISGPSSRAKKIITGQSKVIDLTNSVWNGSTTIFPIFKTETCNAQLTIDGETDTFNVPVKIKSVKVNNGLVVADFENNINPAWTRFAQSGANMDFNVKTDTFSPQGAKHLKMAGTVNWDWLIGQIEFPARAYGGTNSFPLSTNPNDVYFNCLIYGVGNTNESLVLFQFREDENADGVISGTADDKYDYQVTVNWTGWRLVSVKYSDLITLDNGQPTTPRGNSQHNPNKLGKISMLHLANKDNGYASCKIDYLIFTNSPLQP